MLFHQEDILFRLKNIKKIKSWIEKTIIQEKGILGDLNFIFCTDNYLHKINLEYLHHDTFTDIITFDYTQGKRISGDIFISIERVRENAKKFNQTIDNELNRVLIHGVLHLMGYKDKTPKEKETMRAKEDFYLTLFS
ncbi:MAG: rRNA maturation RNase YbeY [Vicingaceae bacterium]|nr:rRNA maturation RNase YbeY [Vicingaceae bacterium]